MIKRFFILVLISFILVMGCSVKEKEFTETNNKKIEDIIKENNYVIVDVRTEEEFLNGHIKEAINIPYDEISSDTLLDKNKTILVYCRSGRRSQIAYNTLKNLGYDAIDLGAYDSINLERSK